MITRIKINGFKAFKDFEIELAPFTLIAGVNGSGKSNLFDALHLISRLMVDDLKTAFSHQRGDVKELFTMYSDGRCAEFMEFEIDMLVDRDVRDSWGGEKVLKYTRLRYRLVIKRTNDNRGIERLIIKEEDLRTIKYLEDSWIKEYIPNEDHRYYWRPKVKTGRRGKPYIDTQLTNGITTISLRQDGDRGGRPIPAQEVEKTVLSSINDVAFPHAYAAKKELSKWKFLHLNPTVMREPSRRTDKDVIMEDGKNLAAALYRIFKDDSGTIKDISRELNNLLPDIRQINVEEDLTRDIFVLSALSTDKRIFSSRVLSEGTLRMIALTVLKHDDTHNGVLCYEEPENGIHPFRIKAILELMSGLSTDFENDIDKGLPLRQIITNTHSPVLVAESIKNNEIKILYAQQATFLDNKNKQKVKITRMLNVHKKKVINSIQLSLELDDKKSIDSDFKSEKQYYISPSEVIHYLQTTDIIETNE